MLSPHSDNSGKPQKPASLRVVIADDNGRMREMLTKTLASLGHRVVGSAQNGQEAIEMVRKAAPDLVILDIDMPDGDGIEAAQAILGLRTLPIIFCTGHSDRETLHRVRNFTVASFLTKPFSPAQLKVAVTLAVPEESTAG